MNLRILSSFLKILVVLTVVAGTASNLLGVSEGSLELTPHEREAFADQFVHEKLALWQNRLQLQDWKISVIVSHPGDLRRGTLGNIHWDVGQMTATIRVLSAADHKGTFAAALDDMEFTVVHELIHLELCPVTRTEENRSGESRTAEENAVNRIAASFLHLEHRDEKPLHAASN